MFRNRCLQNNFSSSKNISHVLMDGGVLSVPFDRLDNFYQICVQCIKEGENIFVVEQKTQCYNFFLDIDYKDTVVLDIDQIQPISKTIFSKVKNFCKDDQKVIVSVSKPKKKDGLIKTGIHINFPDLFVDQHGAIQLMYHIIHTLNNIYPDIDWFKYIDPSVYGSLNNKTKGSGFRMPWSHKRSKHEECKGQGCESCNQSGKITENEYLPIFMLYQNEEILLSQEPTVEMLHLTTVRSSRNESTCVSIPDAVEMPKVIQKVEKTFTKAQTRNEIFDNDLSPLLETFIRKYLPGQKDARVLKIFKNKTTFLILTNSKYCENLGRNHSSNHVYFLVRNFDSTICQKCFCTCETTEGRKHGFCKDFEGRKNNLTSRICEIMFDNTKKKKR
jgi:hypothetical protein